MSIFHETSKTSFWTFFAQNPRRRRTFSKYPLVTFSSDNILTPCKKIRRKTADKRKNGRTNMRRVFFRNSLPGSDIEIIFLLIGDLKF